MKVLTTAGLTKLIELSKDTFLDKNNTIDIASALSDVAVSGSYNDLSNQPSFNGIVLDNTTSTSYYGVSTSAADATQKEVSIPSITKLEAGQVIIVKPTITSTVANSTIKLNDFYPYPMRYGSAAITTSTDSVVWYAEVPSTFVFDGEYWRFVSRGGDNNTTYTINYTVDAGNYKAGVGSYAISRYSLIMQKPDETWEKVTATNATYSAGTTKSVNTTGFLLNEIRYYGTTTNLANGALAASNTCYNKAASVDMRYSTNCGATTTWTAGQYLYLVGSINSTDGLFYLDTTQWWTNALPTTNDGKLYIRLGIVLTSSSYTMSLLEDRPIFYHDGTKICEYLEADNKQDLLVSGTNIKTINNQSVLGSGNLTIDSLPAQSGNANKFLTTNGTSASWANVPNEIPSQSGQSGKFLTTNGTAVSWANVDALPSQTSQSGKFLTTNGTTASWASLGTMAVESKDDYVPKTRKVNNKALSADISLTASDVGAVASNTAITGATKCKITYDSKGLVTAGADLAASDIPNLSLSKITDVTATAAELNVLDGITASTTELNYVDGVTSNVQTQLNTITGKIPSAATSSNQLADKAFVNSSINAVAAYYVTADTSGNAFATHAALVAGPYYYDGAARTPTKNDYAIVLVDEDHNSASTRYTYTGSQWAFQYVVNDTAMTQSQINAINSGITSTKVGNYDNHIADTTIHVTSTDKTNWNNKVDKTSSNTKIYATTNTGTQTTLDYSIGNEGATIAQRTAAGQLAVAQTPTENTHATSKKYVDDGLAGKQATLTAGTGITISSNTISTDRTSVSFVDWSA